MTETRLDRQEKAAEHALGAAIREVRLREGLTVKEVVQNTDTYFDDWTIEKIERGEEDRMFLSFPNIVRLIVEGLQVEVSEVMEAMMQKLRSPEEAGADLTQPLIGSPSAALDSLDLRSASLASFYDRAGQLPEKLAALMAAPAAPIGDHPDIPEAAGLYLLSADAAAWNEGNSGFEFADGVERPILARVTRNLLQHLDEELVRPDSSNPDGLLMALARQDREHDFSSDPDPKPAEQLIANESFQAALRRARDRIAEFDVRFVTGNDLTQLRLLAIYAELCLETLITNSFEYEWSWTTA